MAYDGHCSMSAPLLTRNLYISLFSHFYAQARLDYSKTSVTQISPSSVFINAISISLLSNYHSNT